MGELPLLTRARSRVRLGLATVVLVAGAAGHGQTPPLLVSFGATDSLGFWPPEAIRVDVVWDGMGASGPCVIENLTNGDMIVRELVEIDTTMSSVTVPFGSGWSLGGTAIADTIMQAFYGHVIAASVDGVADTARIGCEPARLALSPAQVAVDTVTTLTLADRDLNRDNGRADTAWVAWQSVRQPATGRLALVETSSSSGLFRVAAPVVCALDADPPADALVVLDADTLRFSLWDSLAVAEGWAHPEGSAIRLDQPIATSTASLTLAHAQYGEIAFLPLDGSPVDVRLLEPDLAGSGTVPVSVVVTSPQGAWRDSATVHLSEGERGRFTREVALGQELAAEPGDSIVVAYTDRADAHGAQWVVRATSALGARVIAGTIADTLWLPGLPLLLADSVRVQSGHHLRVAPGCRVGALPGRDIAWRIDGTVDIGGEYTDSVLVSSASRHGAAGDWAGIVVMGSLRAEGVAIGHAETGVRVAPGATLVLEHARVHDCGSVQPLDAGVWRRSREAKLLGATAREASAIPAGVVSLGSSTIRHATVAHGNGFGVAITGGACTLTGSLLTDNALDGLLVVDASCAVESIDIARNGQGGVYTDESTLALVSSVVRDNEVEGLYGVGGESELAFCELRGNGGGLRARDGHQSRIEASFISGNHHFGIDEAWGCTVIVDSSAVVGNGGSGIVADYASNLYASAAAVAFNRRFSVAVGPWCISDTLDARLCWWGSPEPPMDSTGTNCSLIWDGRDSPGRAIVQFSPWLTQPPPEPAPLELVPAGGERLAFVAGGGGPGDTLCLELEPSDASSARYAGVAVASPRDTLVCVVVSDDVHGGGTLRGRVALVLSADLSAPDRLSAATADEIVAWWLADSTVRAHLTLPAALPEEVPLLVRLRACPNPFSSRLSLSWTGPTPWVDLSLHDISGRRCWEQRAAGACGAAVVDPVVTAALPNGIYIASVRAAHRAAHIRVVKIR